MVLMEKSVYRCDTIEFDNVMKNHLYEMSEHVLDIISEYNQTYHTQRLVIIV